jgi:hypothetical protein
MEKGAFLGDEMSGAIKTVTSFSLTAEKVAFSVKQAKRGSTDSYTIRFPVLLANWLKGWAAKIWELENRNNPPSVQNVANRFLYEIRASVENERVLAGEMTGEVASFLKVEEELNEQYLAAKRLLHVGASGIDRYQNYTIRFDAELVAWLKKMAPALEVVTKTNNMTVQQAAVTLLEQLMLSSS